MNLFLHALGQRIGCIILTWFVIFLSGCATPQEEDIGFPYSCNGQFRDTTPSPEQISTIRRAHEKWVESQKSPESDKANFCGAKLAGYDFQKTQLHHSMFQMAMLAGANFTAAMLDNAQLQGSNLSKADFSEAHLIGAEFDHAMLHLAVFRKSHLRNASMRYAMLAKTIFEGVDLRKVEGLTQSQIDMACLDDKTQLPKTLIRPKPCEPRLVDSRKEK